MKNKMIYFLISFAVIFGIHGCQDEKTEDTARVQLRLVDASGPYKKVNVEIIDIQYKGAEEDAWTSFNPAEGYPIKVDLTKLIAGNDLLLADEIVPAGIFGQIRLVLSENNTLVLNDSPDVEIPMDTPSAQQSGLKLKLNEELEPGFSYTFILDWDVQKSIVKAGNSGKYNLKPVIRVNAKVNSGSVSGIVKGESLEVGVTESSPLEGVVVAIYNTDNEYVTETSTDMAGTFLIQGLQPGDYKIIIDEPAYQTYTTTDLITVKAGEVSNLGTLLLKVPEEI